MMDKREVNSWSNTYGSLGSSAAPRLMELPLAVLDPWSSPDGSPQPFKPYRQDKLEEMAQSIRDNGILESIRVRPRNGRFQILAGHNRCNAAKLAGLGKVPCIVEEVDDNKATLIMVQSNLQHREKLLPSEKGRAYKMQLEALKQQGHRSDLTSSQVGTKLRADEVVAASGSDSRNQVQRYIRLTYLHPTLLDMVDEEKIGFTPGVELSYLKAPDQELLVTLIGCFGIKKISGKQAKLLRQAGPLTQELILDIFGFGIPKAKPVKPELLQLPSARILNFFPPNTSAEAMEAEIYEALLAYRKNHRSPASN